MFSQLVRSVKETLWNVPSPVPSAIVFEISSILSLAGYITKCFARIVSGAIVRTELQLVKCCISFYQPYFIGSSTYSHNSVLSFPPMSPKSVSVQGGIVKRNHLHHRYLVPFAGILTFILPPLFFTPTRQLAAAKHQSHCLAVGNLAV
ncbi:unnamed protein product [Protopolystoma xenopodis]|uniref:Uncharacterized protein n=1 Tax=Protopolystoma xenopodis TaxID=117903 RepID=A0A3S5BKE4_9PLAT|nr:unnamed protein product [Protopolystoma xenopodis]